MYKNIANQKLAVYAHDTLNDAAKAGDAANITAQISKDGAACAATDDANPTELDAANAPGVYLFDLTQDETNGNLIILCASSSTTGVLLEPVFAYTDNDPAAGIGATAFTYTLTSSVDGSPIVAARVWITADAGGANILAAGTTDANGQATFYLSTGTVYVWRELAGYTFTNPDEETVA